jgi:hypothetical protein
MPAVLALVAVAALAAACGGDDDPTDGTGTPTSAPTSAPASATQAPTIAPTATAAPEETETPTVGVSVTLSDYAVTVDSASGPAGDYTFSIANDGPAESHVFMIVETDLAPDALPVTSSGQFAPSDAATILANTPGIGAGGTDTLTYTLEVGNYVFICNNVDSEGQGHYAKGMSTGFTVD